MVAVGAIVMLALPVSSYEATESALGHVDNHNSVYTWKCPNASGSGYHDESIVLEISEQEFRESMSRDVMRSGTKMVSAPVGLIDPVDPYVVRIADHVISVTSGYTDDRRIDAALNFVRTSIRYTYDDSLYGADDFWAAPLETLYLHRGDCEDTAVLLCSIYLAMGFDSFLLDFPGHVAVGLCQDDSEGYLFCETASDRPGHVGETGAEWASQNPDVYRYGDTFAFGPLASFFAAYRNLISKVSGA